MYKVLLVDDEPIVLEGIARLVPWEAHDMCLIGTASHGFGAYDFIEREDPDIVICDIKMPGMNGLELISRTQAIKSRATYIILSGHGEFEFAKRAMELGVKHYVLKPGNELEIISVLDRVIVDLEEKRKEAKQLSQIERAFQSLAKRLSVDVHSISAPEGKLPSENLEEGMSFSRCKGNEVVHQMVKYVGDNLADPAITLTHLAKQVFFMNPEYLGKLFREEMGVRFSDYLMGVRVGIAQDLITSSDTTIGEIAERVGFADNSQYFSQVFKKLTGCTPSTYRKRYANKRDFNGGDANGRAGYRT